MSDRRVVFAIPGDLDTPSGGYAYARRMFDELPAQGWTVSHLPLGPGFPSASEPVVHDAYRALATVPPGAVALVDGLALGVLPEAGRFLGERSPLVALVHHPLALESGVPAGRANELRQSERAALAGAARVVATSRTTAATLVSEYGVPAERLAVAVPGTDPAPFAAGSDSPTAHLLSVGSLVPRKGHDVLLSALAECRHARWQLTIVGDDTRDAATAAALRALARAHGLEDRVTFTGAVDSSRLEALYAGADLFVLASRHEGFGMAGTEAVARGLAVVSTTAGAIPESLPADAACLVAPDDVPALRDVLTSLLSDRQRLRALSGHARAASARLARWSHTASALGGALELALERR